MLGTSSAQAPKRHPLLLLSFLPGLKRTHQSCGSSPRPKQFRKQQQGGYQGGKWIALGQGPRPWTLSPDHRLPAGQGLLSSRLPGGPGWAEEGGRSGREALPSPQE